MHNINHVFHHCCNLLDNIGIEYGEIVSVTVNTRARNRWGQCKNQGCGQFTINISEKLLQDNIDIVHLETTMIHEILHTCYGCMNHGARWKMYAEKVNRAYGYNIRRCTSYAEKGVEPPKPKPPKYTFTCEDCGRTWLRQRMPKWANIPTRDVYINATCPCGKNKILITINR